MPMRGLLVCLLGVGLMLTGGCGDAAAPETRSSPSAADERSPLVVVDDELQVTCGGGLGFPVSRMPEGDPTLADHDEVVDALERLVDEAPMDAPGALLDADGIQDEDWILLTLGEYDGRKVLVVGTGPWTAEGPEGGANDIGLEWRSGRWEARSWGGCQLEPLLRPDLSWAEMSAPKGGLSRQSAEVIVGVNEIDCTSSRDPAPYLHEPFVVESEATVTVYWTSTPPHGGQSCPGNPTVERTITLAEPLGNRPLLDGSNFPPTPVE